MQYTKLLLYCTVVLYCTLDCTASIVLYKQKIVEEEWELAGTLAAGTSSGAPEVCAVWWTSWYLVCPTPSQPLPQEGFTQQNGCPMKSGTEPKPSAGS